MYDFCCPYSVVGYNSVPNPPPAVENQRQLWGEGSASQALAPMEKKSEGVHTRSSNNFRGVEDTSVSGEITKAFEPNKGASQSSS